MKKKEIYCDDCRSEYVIVHEDEDKIEFCPMCGYEVITQTEDDYDEEETFEEMEET